MTKARRASLNDNYFKNFYLCYCDKQEYLPGILSEIYVDEHYVLCYVLSGKGKICLENKEILLSAGQGLLIFPGRTCRYIAEQESSWNCLRIGLSGDKAVQILSELGFHDFERKFSCKNIQQLDKLSEQLLDATRGTLEQILLRQFLFYEFFSVIVSGFDTETYPTTGFNEYVIEAIQWIKENYGDASLRVSDVADYLGISRNYLCTLFKQAMGHSPQEYICSFRLSRARELLAATEYSIDGISYSCGYEDPVVFSRAFKKSIKYPLPNTVHICMSKKSFFKITAHPA